MLSRRGSLLLLACCVVVDGMSLMSLEYSEDAFEVQQIHIALGEQPDEMVVMWTTMNETESKVDYGRGEEELRASGECWEFINEGDAKRAEWFHKVTLKGLRPDREYWYMCGGSMGMSEKLTFRTLPEGADWSVKLAVYGDLGLLNGRSIPRLTEEVHRGDYHAILHVGDFAYDLHDWGGRVGDRFMNLIEPIAARLPYMTCAGNHEVSRNFSQYKNRFSMPRDEGNLYFSFDMGPAHFISINTEYYYATNYGTEPIINQYNWLEQDLKMATHPENRAKRPWIILFGHRPFYCSNRTKGDCLGDTPLRVGIPEIGGYGLEDLLNKYGVDLAIWAHEHSYERFWPVYDTVVYNGSYEQPYTNPKALTQILTGSAGCEEFHDWFKNDVPDFSAFRSVKFGYTKMHVYNETHLHLQQVSSFESGDVQDSFWLIRDEHTPYNLW